MLPPRGGQTEDRQAPGDRQDPSSSGAAAAGGEDPRIAQRRLGVAGDARRRRRIILAVVAGVVGVGAVAVGLLRSPLLAVDQIQVVGAETTDRSAVTAASGVHRGDAIVDVDPALVRADVMALPSVASARVERVWPHTVRITVTEEIPLATFDAGGRSVLVGRGGRILSEIGSPAATGGSAEVRHVVVAAGVVAHLGRPGAMLADDLAPTVAMVEQLPPRLAARMQEVSVGADGALSVTLRDDGGRVDLGAPEDVPAKLLATESILAAVDQHCLDVLDVRDPTRPTISRRAGCAIAAPTVGASGGAPQPTAGGSAQTRPATPKVSPTTTPTRRAGG